MDSVDGGFTGVRQDEGHVSHVVVGIDVFELRIEEQREVEIDEVLLGLSKRS